MADSRLTQPRDLIGDIHAQQRRKLFRRVALGVALFVMLLLIAIALKFLADRRHRDACLTEATQGFSLGTSAELVIVATKLETCIGEHPKDPLLHGALALTRAQLLAEFGESDEEAHDAVAALADLEFPTHDGELAQVMLDLDDGNLDSARDRLPTIADMDDTSSIAPNHEVWVSGMLAIADPEANIDDAIDTITATLPDDGSISIRRLLATLHMHAGDPAPALAQLVDARARSQTHLGLAADEALYNALLRQKLAGVADVADQLLGGGFEIAQRDRAHALLARGVVRVQSGEIEEGMKLVDQAWVMLPGWDKLSRTLALEMAMEAGDGARARKWIDEAGLRASESEIYEAWVKLVEGDVMSALEDLAKLPQEHPRVALLQGLALVEQNRFVEAQPWLERADKLIPGRVDVEVARARVEVHTGDPEAARRKLDALSAEEPFAPRAWTGLGEANVAVAYRDSKTKPGGKPDATALRDARRAFRKAVEIERMPSEAYLHLAELTDAKRREDPKLVPEVLDLFAKAVAANPKLPRYAEREALYLAELNFRTQAIDKLEAVLDRPGTTAQVPLALAQLALRQIEFGDRVELPPKFDEWLEQAKTRGGVPPRTLDLLAARAMLARQQPKEALAKLEPLLAANEADLDARIYIVHAHMDLRDRDTALAVVKRGLGVLPDEVKGRLYFDWANVMARGGKRRPAANYANNGWKKLAKQSDVSVAEFLLHAEDAIRLLNRDMQPKPAAVIGREITELVPFHSDAWVIRADAEMRTNRGSDAKASAEKAVDLDDENARAHEVLAQVWLRFGYKDRAKESFERALELAAGTPREKDIKKSLAGVG
ncbi:tetratricopeptide repeat protein [Enhygromyxa salina]|uniref:Beta-barrel assembly-enhancing protease n=1 Tax=Enhygromyxa salina TaxID=215803 RepID=A0A2S9YTU4_9BACT|nr:tetratricopeptide repeat protein [Enhygromyxa salina]PRQ08500.1 Beta-barrel assembly-enhancing protease [Enhygromyxa salina]